MSAIVPELAIIDKEGSLFDRGDRYEIPLYQRPYAWGEEHIERLIEDVDDIPADGDQRYYLGSLVVARKGDSLWEVIDGQQRLTTLYLLLSALGIREDEDNGTLTFSCRAKSDYTLAHLGKLGITGEVEDRLVEQNIANGMRVIRQKLATDFDEKGLAALRKKLTKTCLYRIEVPNRTDLNHYFEIMNTRGEQLEQHEVLKAWLMEPLSGRNAAMFASIWDACSDMSCYVQMRFDVSTREKLFGWSFDAFPTSARINSVSWNTDKGGNSLGIKDIISSRAVDSIQQGEEGDDPSRFESVIDFRFFLLHALKVFARTKRIGGKEPDVPLIASLLDDKKLGSTFREVVTEGLWDGRPVDRARFSIEFAECLLQTRFLFDKCIVKREYVGGDLDGRWSLKELRRESKKSYRYSNTRFKRAKNQWASTLDKTDRSALMIQSCLRVSYTSPKVMHWITELLARLMEDPSLAGSEAFVLVSEECAKGAVREFLDSGNYMQGVNTQHIVLNYLDYLLWSRDKRRYDNFVFEFRTSVEHWYPQNPSDDTFVKWGEVDRFGNLCLVQRNVNSKFSNLNPVAKKSTYQEMIARGSLKLRRMSELTQGIEDWKAGACQAHEEEMLSILREACGARTD